jgi:hypothetical protein
MVLRLIVCINVLWSAVPTLGVAAEWKRYYASGPGSQTWDTPTAHPLSYFRVHPCSRSDPDDHIISCPKQATAKEIEERAKTRVDVTLATTIGSFRIYDLDYFFASQLIEGPHLRSVLAQTATDEFHEIYVVERIDLQSVILPSTVVEAGQQQLLKEHYTNGGIYANFYEDYFVGIEDALKQVDMDPVYNTPGDILPPAKTAWESGARFDFPEFVWSAPVADADAGRMGCCRGLVTVRFRIEKTRAVVTGVKYDPDADITKRR